MTVAVLRRNLPSIVVFIALASISITIVWQIMSAIDRMEITAEGEIVDVDDKWVEVQFIDSGGEFYFENELPSYVVENAWVKVRFTWNPPRILEFIGPTEKPSANVPRPYMWMFAILGIVLSAAVILRLLTRNKGGSKK